MTELDELPVEAFTPGKNVTSSGWRIKEIGEPTEHLKYVHQMAAKMLAGPRPPKPIVPTHFNGKLITDLLPDEREAFYFSMQPESTKAAITRQKTRDPSQDKEFSLRPMSDDWLAVKDAKSHDEMTGMGSNKVSVNDMSAVLAARQAPKNAFGDAHDTPTLTPQMREKAVQAFVYSKPHDLKDEEIKRITKLEEIANTPIEPELPKKRGFWSRLFGAKEEVTEKKYKTRLRVGGNGIIDVGIYEDR